MQSGHIWDKFHIHRQKIVLILLLLPLAGWAQREVIHNKNYDARKAITYGFSIGFHRSMFVRDYSASIVDWPDSVYLTNPSLTPLDSVHSIVPKWSIGFSLGFIINARLNENMDVRITPKVGFYEYKLEYNYLNADQHVEVEESTVVELPLLFKYKSARRLNTRMYFVGGFTPGFEASGTSDLEENAEFLQIGKFNFSAEIGFGLDIYYPLFKFSPEIRFSKGLVNLLSDKKNDLSVGLDRLSTNVVALYFHFQ